MSFVANRVYTMDTGKLYNPSNNGNTVFKFTGEVTAGSANITARGGALYARIAAIVAAGGTPTISGVGFVEPITLSPRVPINPASASPTIDTLGVLSTLTGTFEYVLFDSDVPSSNDSPILAFHVIDNTSPLEFVTLTGDSVKLAAGTYIVGAVYNYGIQEVINIGAKGDILGLAPKLKVGY